MRFLIFLSLLFVSRAFSATDAVNNNLPQTSLERRPQTVEEAQFYNLLTRFSRCSTIQSTSCRFTIPTAQDLLYYFRHCLRLNKWILTYNYPAQSHLSMILTKDPKGTAACLITVRNTANNVEQQCLIKQKQLNILLTSPELFTFLRDFNNQPNYGQLYTDPMLTVFNTCLTTNPH